MARVDYVETSVETPFDLARFFNALSFVKRVLLKVLILDSGKDYSYEDIHISSNVTKEKSGMRSEKRKKVLHDLSEQQSHNALATFI